MGSRIHAPLVLTLALIVVLVLSLLAGGLLLQRVVGGSFRSAETLRSARALAADVLKAQLDEETGVRGYAVSHQNELLGPYYQGRSLFPNAVARLRPLLVRMHLPEAARALDDAVFVNERWEAHVAGPLRNRQHANVYLLLHGKWLVDRLRIDVARVDAALARRTALSDQQAEAATFWVAAFAAGAVIAIALAAMIFTVQQYRLTQRLERQRTEAEAERSQAAQMQAALAAEKRIADTLQTAISQRIFPAMPTVSFNATYVPAREEALVGGDWYDAVQLSDERVLLAIGDVTGHGIDAVITMNRARELLIRSALLDADPAHVLERVNIELLRSTSQIVTAIAGIVNTRKCEFLYAAAGHPPPVLLEPNGRAQLLEFGSLPLGVTAEAAYATRHIETVPGALIVLYTDGVIEHSRDLAEGEALLLAAVEWAAARPELDVAESIRDSIFGTRRIADDVAILTIRFTSIPGGATLSGHGDAAMFIGGAKTGTLLETGPNAYRRIA